MRDEEFRGFSGSGFRVSRVFIGFLGFIGFIGFIVSMSTLGGRVLDSLKSEVPGHSVLRLGRPKHQASNGVASLVSYNYY